MARPDYSTKLDTILAAPTHTRAWRVLTGDLTWPAGDPPFAAGQAVSAPALPGDTPDPEEWTDVTAYVQSWHYTQDAGLQIGQLSLSVPLETPAATLATAFREMRVILVQERYTGAGQDTGWFSVCWCLSDGYQEEWNPWHRYTVNAKDALKLAHLDPLGAGGGVAVFQPDRVTIGSIGEHYQLSRVNEAAEDAYEFAILSPTGAIQPNWADRPPPQMWCHNPQGDSGLEPVPLAIAANAAQVVFGEGVLRLNKVYVHAAPGSDPSAPDYAVGLGIAEGTVPDVRGVVTRFVHPATTDRDGAALSSDVARGLAQIENPPVAGRVRVTADLSALPQRLTLLAADGSGRRWATTSHTYAGGATTVFLANTGATVATGTALDYGDANRLTDVVSQMLLGAGYRAYDHSAPNTPLAILPPEQPLVLGVAEEITLPPLVYRDSDELTALDAIEALRREGYAPPAWLPVADALGRVQLKNIAQVSGADVLPLARVVTAAMDRSDTQVYTRVIARGRRRQVVDYTRAGATIADVAGAEGLPAPAYSLDGQAVRSSPGSGDYVFALANVLTDRLGPSTIPNPKVRTATTTAAPVVSPKLAASLVQQAQAEARAAGDLTSLSLTDNRALRPWAWYYQSPSLANTDALRAQWRGAHLAEITLGASPVSVDGLDLNVSNTWIDAFNRGNPRAASDQAGWGDGTRFHNQGGGLGTSGRYAGVTPQVLAIYYYDTAQAAWLPLVSYAPAALEYPEVIRLTSDEFDTRGPVETTALRLVCVEPCLVEMGTYDERYYHAIIGVWLSRIKVWSAPDIRGVAELGTAPFDGAAWTAIRARLRRRTWVLPGVAPWANTQARADDLAASWLQDLTRDLAPRRLEAVRPDASLWDTASVTLPTGAAETYLLTSVDRSSAPTAALTGTDYTAPYPEG